ncbi:MAG: YitT family protein, partial [Bacilli bacterium]|nr:YitT family protein [Bacilli bacterium]
MEENKIKNIVFKESKISNIQRYIQMIISVFILALLYNVIIQPANITSGGINSIAILLKHLFRIKPLLTISCLTAFFIFISYVFLGKKKTRGTLIAAILYPLFVYLTSFLRPLINIDMSDMLMISILVGVISGFCNGLLYKTGFSNGGLPVISQILNKKFKIPMGKSNLVINSIIVLIGGYYFGLNMIMYAIIINYINSIIVDKIMLGISKNKSIYIVTKEKEKIKKFIIEDMKHSVTILKGEGAYLNKKEDVILSIIPTREYFEITESIKLIDPDVFYIVSDAYEVKG